jgi:predicted hydrocarbon binding protein
VRYPKDIEIWEHAPGRRIAQVVIHIRNEKGALAKCSEAIMGLGVNILTGFVTAPSRSSTAALSFFADITDAPGGLAEIKRALQGLDVIESVEAVAAEDGFMVDRQHFPVRWAGRRAVVMRASALTEMLDRLWAVFGTGAVTIVDQMADAMGRQSAKEIIEDFGPEFANKQLEELLGTYSALGFADISVERAKSSDFPLVVDAKDLFECEGNARSRARRKSVFFRAHLRGFMSATFGEPFEVTEVQCIAQGDDVCSFKVAIQEAEAPSLSARAHERHARASSESNF